MTSLAIAFPILPGMSEKVRWLAAEVQGPRHSEMGASQRAHGIVRENWYIQSTPQGEMVIVYMEAEDPMRALQEWALSQAPFDIWFKQQVGEICGIDFNQPIPALPEQVFAWQAR